MATNRNRISVYRNHTSGRNAGYLDGNAVRKIAAVPERREERRIGTQEVPATREKRERAPRMSAKYLALLGICSVAMFGTCTKYLKLKDQVTDKTAAISTIAMKTESVKAQNDAIDYSINGYKDTANIAEQAKSIGMIQAGKDQTRFYQSSESEYMKQYKDIPTE